MRLYDLLFRDEDSSDETVARIGTLLDESPVIRDAVEGGLGSSSWSLLKDQVATRLDALLDVEVAEILARAWKKYRVLQEFADTTKHGPDDVSIVPMLDHTISSEHSPKLEVVIADQVVATLTLDVTAELKVEGINLAIQNARITEIRLARLSAGGTISCQGVELLSAETKPVDLPGHFNLGEGIPIAAEDPE
jgi:hypothetical protein